MDSIINMVEPVVEPMVEPMVINIITGWWWLEYEFYFPIHIGNFIIPTDFYSIFQDGIGLNHQPAIRSWWVLPPWNAHLGFIRWSDTTLRGAENHMIWKS